MSGRPPMEDARGVQGKQGPAMPRVPPRHRRATPRRRIDNRRVMNAIASVFRTGC
ncbi:hypothetical protein EVK84_02830 [Edwardsiella piscicida]|nr:hypothetical protein EVK84_02830 [Edwardsiella piscicida]